MSPVKEGYFARVCLSGFQEEIATSDKLQPSLTLRVLTSVADRVYLALPTTIFKGTDQSDLRVLVAVAHCCTQGIAQATVAGIESTTEGRPELNPSVLSDEWVLHRFHSVCWSRKPSIARHRRRMSCMVLRTGFLAGTTERVTWQMELRDSAAQEPPFPNFCGAAQLSSPKTVNDHRKDYWHAGPAPRSDISDPARIIPSLKSPHGNGHSEELERSSSVALPGLQTLRANRRHYP